MLRFSPLQLIALLGVALVALNLRGPFTSLAPVLEQIMDGLSLSASSAGFVTALPLISLAIFSPIAPKLAQRTGLEKALVIALMCIAIGVGIRSAGALSTLYLGTILLGAGVAFGNVLLPAVVKNLFPEKISVVTSLYIFVMGIGSTLSSSLMVPLSHNAPDGLSGWQFALGFNLLFPLAALLFWLPKLTKSTKAEVGNTADKPVSIFSIARSPITWQVTMALGINSFSFYSFAGWLPKILSDYGYSELDAGYIYGLLQFSTMIPGLILMPILARMNNHVLLVGVTSASIVVGLIGMIVMPSWAIFWVVLFGLGNCATFIITLSFIGLRTSTPQQAATLSGMAQSIGYALAATGPSLVGYSHTVTLGWAQPIAIIAAFATACTIFSCLAARDRKI